MDTVSVVTVCYNAEKEIEKTIQSVLKQTYTNFEYIIVDGKSTDKTMEIVNKYVCQFQEKGINCKVLSEKDKGIYDAMNKGVELAECDWVIFMNAGDLFYNEAVLEKMFKEDCSEFDIVYGDTELSSQGYFRLSKGRPFSQIEKSMPFCHQSVFVKRNVLKDNKFNTSYRIAADYDLFVRLYKKNARHKHIEEIVSTYDMSGISETMHTLCLKEEAVTRNANNIKQSNLYYSILMTQLILFRRKLIIKFMPQMYYSEERGWYKKDA